MVKCNVLFPTRGWAKGYCNKLRTKKRENIPNFLDFWMGWFSCKNTKMSQILYVQMQMHEIRGQSSSLSVGNGVLSNLSTLGVVYTEKNNRIFHQTWVFWKWDSREVHQARRLFLLSCFTQEGANCHGQIFWSEAFEVKTRLLSLLENASDYHWWWWQLLQITFIPEKNWCARNLNYSMWIMCTTGFHKAELHNYSFPCGWNPVWKGN